LTGSAFTLDIPLEYHTLENGLRVVLSRDASAPIVMVAVYYHVGMRLEPRGRTGFAHLFEHLMFQGSEQLPKGEFFKLVQGNGGTFNGSTRLDFTNYFEAMPKHTLDVTLWAEADRMRGLAITQAELDNQRDVVKNEVRQAVLNRPYGGFPWIDMQEHAFTNWHNSHNGYGDMEDLDAASLEDVQRFFDAYYSPANAALVVVGDIDPAEALELARRHFEDIPAAPRPEPPDIEEPRRTAEHRASKPDALANRPALCVSYHAPERNTPEYFAMGLLDQVLAQGDDSRLYRELVSRRGFAGELDGGINFLGHMYNAHSPLLWSSWLFHDSDVAADAIVDAAGEVIEVLRDDLLDDDAFQRALVKARSAYYDMAGGQFYPLFGRADLLASFALIDDDPGRINAIDEMYAQVTPELVRETAREYLRPDNRVVLTVEPEAAP
jgi:predicted Zn-dependent peptidase